VDEPEGTVEKTALPFQAQGGVANNPPFRRYRNDDRNLNTFFFAPGDRTTFWPLLRRTIGGSPRYLACDFPMPETPRLPVMPLLIIYISYGK
jgi:hypothetical protein